MDKKTATVIGALASGAGIAIGAWLAKKLNKEEQESEAMAFDPKDLPAMLIVEDGLFFPQCGNNGYLLEWRYIQGARQEENEPDILHVGLVGDLEISVRNEDWDDARESIGFPGRALGFAQLFHLYGPKVMEEETENGEDENKEAESEDDENQPHTEEMLGRFIERTIHGDFANAAADDLCAAIVLVKADTRIVIDPSATYKAFEALLKVVNPDTASESANMAGAWAKDAAHALAIKRAIAEAVYNYIGRIGALTEAFDELITPEFLPEKGDRTHLRRLAKNANASVQSFREFAKTLATEDSH